MRPVPGARRNRSRLSTEHLPNAVQYGWAELLFDGASVSVASSATERTGLGIYAGTGQAFPEPATAGGVLRST